MIFCVGCLQQENHLNNGISEWEASNIKYGSVIQWINAKHGFCKTNGCTAWSQNDSHVYECSRIYSASNIHDIVQPWSSSASEVSLQQRQAEVTANFQ